MTPLEKIYAAIELLLDVKKELQGNDSNQGDDSNDTAKGPAIAADSGGSTPPGTGQPGTP